VSEEERRDVKVLVRMKGMVGMKRNRKRGKVKREGKIGALNR